MLGDKHVIRYFDFFHYLIFLAFLNQDENAFVSMTYPTVENRYI